MTRSHGRRNDEQDSRGNCSGCLRLRRRLFLLRDELEQFLGIGLEAFLVSEQSYQIVFACVQKEPWAIVWSQIDPLAMNVAVAIV